MDIYLKTKNKKTSNMYCVLEELVGTRIEPSTQHSAGIWRVQGLIPSHNAHFDYLVKKALFRTQGMACSEVASTKCKKGIQEFDIFAFLNHFDYCYRTRYHCHKLVDKKERHLGQSF